MTPYGASAIELTCEDGRGEKGLLVSSASYVGRVGALAVALGIGAAVSASPIAWADEESSSSASSTSSQGNSASDSDAGGAASNGPSSRPTGTSPTPAHRDVSTPAKTRVQPRSDTDTNADTDTDSDGDGDSGADGPRHGGGSGVAAPPGTEPSSTDASTPAEVSTPPAVEPEAVTPDVEAGSAHQPTSTGSDHYQPDTDRQPHAVVVSSAQPSATTPVKATASGTPKPVETVAASGANTLKPAVGAPATATSAPTALGVASVAATVAAPSAPQTLVAVVRRIVDALLAPLMTPLPVGPDSSPILLVVEWFRRTTVGAFYNRAPGAAPLQIGEDANGKVIGTIGATDPDGDPLTYALAQGPTRGSVAVRADGTYTYTPNSALALDGGTDTFTVNVGDGGWRLFSQTATTPVSVTVQVGAGDALGINGTPFAVAMSPDGKHAYITDSANNRVSVLDVATRAIIGSIAVGGAPSGIAVAGDGRAYVVNSADGTVTVFDTATNRIVRPYVYVGSDPTGIAVNAAGTRVVVANSYEDSVSVIDTGTWNVTRVVVGNGPYGVVISGNHALITNEFDDTVTVLNLSTNTVAATIAVGDSPTGIAAAGNRAVVTNVGTTTTPGDGTVTIIDLGTLTVVGSPIAVGDSPMSVVIDATGSYAYIADQDRSVVSVLDIAAAAMTDNIYAVAAGPTGLALDDDGELFVVGYMSGTVDPLDVGAPATAATTNVSLAAAITTNPATAAPAPPAAPTQEWSTSTKGFDIYNDSLNPLVLTYEGASRPNGGGPAEGTVLAPGAHLHLEIPAGFRAKVVTVVLTQSTGESWKMRLWTNSIFGVNHGDVALRHYDADGNLIDSRLGGGSYWAEFFLPWYVYDRYQVDPIRISESSSTTRRLTIDDPETATLLTACGNDSSAKCTFQANDQPVATWTEWQQAMRTQGRIAYDYNNQTWGRLAYINVGHVDIARLVNNVAVKDGLALEKSIVVRMDDATGKVIPNVRTFTSPLLVYDLTPNTSIRLQIRAPLLRYTGDITIKVGNSTATITGVVYEVPDTQRDVEIAGAVKPGP